MTRVVVVHGISGACGPTWCAYVDSLEIVEFVDENPSISIGPFDPVHAITVGDIVDAVSGMPR